MATQVVTFGPVTAVPDISATAVVVGSGNQWSDDSDATYAEMNRAPSSQVGSAHAAQVETPTMTAPTVTLTARISGPVGSLHRITPVFVLLNATQLAANPTGAGLALGPESSNGTPLYYTPDPGGPMETDTDGLPHTYSVVLPYTTDPYGDGVWADFPTRIAAGGLYMVAWAGFSSGSDLLRVYEVSLTLTTTGAPPLRRYPPVNNSGFGPTRVHPRSPGRVAGKSY